jgi:ribosome-binding factor A
MSGMLQRSRDAIKSVLDRRYEPRVLAEVHRRELADDLSELVDRVSRIEELAGDQDATIAAMRSTHDHVDAALRGIDEALRSIRSSIAALEAETAPAVTFVADEPPHELRKRLFEAHRLARESGRAIELLLQQEVLLKRSLGEVMTHHDPSK